MTGSLRHARHGALADDPYTRAVLRLDNGSDVAYRDVRRFGTWELFEQGELAPYLAARLGPEPLGPFSAAGSASASRGGAHRSSRRSSTSERSPASGTSTSTRRSGGAGCIRCGLRAASTRTSSAACTARSGMCCERGSSGRDRPSVTTRSRTARTERCRTSSAPTAVGESHATVRTTAHAHRRRRAHDDVLPALPDLLEMTPAGAFRGAGGDRQGRRVAILGLILYGSRAAGCSFGTTPTGTYGLIIRVGAFADYEERYDTEHGEQLEIGTDTVDGLRATANPEHRTRGTGTRFAMPRCSSTSSMARSAEIVESKRTLPAEIRQAMPTAALDAYVNSTYRSLKAHRLGETVGSSHGRRPTPQATPRRPVRAPWPGATVVEVSSLRARAEPIAAGAPGGPRRVPRPPREAAPDPSPGHQQHLFRDVEVLARSDGHGGVFDSWGPSLASLRGLVEARERAARRRAARRGAPSDRAPRAPGTTDGVAVDHDERHRPLPAQIPDPLTKCRVVIERHLVEVELARVEQSLGADAESTPLRRIEDDPGHQEA